MPGGFLSGDDCRIQAPVSKARNSMSGMNLRAFAGACRSPILCRRVQGKNKARRHQDKEKI